MELKAGVTTRRLIAGRGAAVGLLSGLSLGFFFGLFLLMLTWDPLLILPVAAVASAGIGAAGALAGLLGGLALLAQRDRVLLDDPRARVVSGVACAAPFLALGAVMSAASAGDTAWAGAGMLLGLWCGVAAAMFGTWIVHGTLAKAPSVHD